MSRKAFGSNDIAIRTNGAGPLYQMAILRFLQCSFDSGPPWRPSACAASHGGCDGSFGRRPWQALDKGFSWRTLWRKDPSDRLLRGHHGEIHPARSAQHHHRHRLCRSSTTAAKPRSRRTWPSPSRPAVAACRSSPTVGTLHRRCSSAAVVLPPAGSARYDPGRRVHRGRAHRGALRGVRRASWWVTPTRGRPLRNRRKIAHSPGLRAATEIREAEELGARSSRCSPAIRSAGPGFVKSMLWARVPLDAHHADGRRAGDASSTAWFKAGVAAVGIGGISSGRHRRRRLRRAASRQDRGGPGVDSRDPGPSEIGHASLRASGPFIVSSPSRGPTLDSLHTVAGNGPLHFGQHGPLVDHGGVTRRLLHQDAVRGALPHWRSPGPCPSGGASTPDVNESPPPVRSVIGMDRRMGAVNHLPLCHRGPHPNRWRPLVLRHCVPMRLRLGKSRATALLGLLVCLQPLPRTAPWRTPSSCTGAPFVRPLPTRKPMKGDGLADLPARLSGSTLER